MQRSYSIKNSTEMKIVFLSFLFLHLRKQTIISSLAYQYFMLCDKELTKSDFSNEWYKLSIPFLRKNVIRLLVVIRNMWNQEWRIYRFEMLWVSSPIYHHSCFVLVNFAVPTTVAKYYFQVQVFNLVCARQYDNQKIFLRSKICVTCY